jgi:hypothetical protein
MSDCLLHSCGASGGGTAIDVVADGMFVGTVEHDSECNKRFAMAAKSRTAADDTYLWCTQGFAATLISNGTGPFRKLPMQP